MRIGAPFSAENRSIYAMLLRGLLQDRLQATAPAQESG
jgi:hypothetical protein